MVKLKTTLVGYWKYAYVHCDGRRREEEEEL
jgi:hypothetical protein